MVSSTMARTASSEISICARAWAATPVALGDEAEENVLGADEAVVEEPRLLLGEHQDPPGTVGEPLEHAL